MHFASDGSSGTATNSANCGEEASEVSWFSGRSFSDILQNHSGFIVLIWVCANYAWTTTFFLNNDDFIWLAHACETPRDTLSLLFPNAWGVFFRPLVQLSFVLNCMLAGTEPFAYHLVNLALHAANTYLVLLLARELTKESLTALITSLAFAVHPVDSDAVTWVSGRTEVLCAVFYFGAALLHLRQKRVFALILYPLALASKETAISLPITILLCEWFVAAGSARWAFCLISYGGVTLVYLLLRWLTLSAFAWGVLGFSNTVPLSWSVVEFLFRSKLTLIAQYIFEPFPLYAGLHISRIASGNFVGAFPTAAVVRSAIALGVLGGATTVTVTHSSRALRRALLFSIGWMSISLLPYLLWRQFMPWYFYLVSFGSCLAFTQLGKRLLSTIPNERIRRVLAVVMVVAWLVAAVVRLQINNQYEWRAGAVTKRAIDAMIALAPLKPHTLFVLLGVDRLRAGTDPWAEKGALGFGLTEAARIWLGEPTIDTQFDLRSSPQPATNSRPLVILEWNSSSRMFDTVHVGVWP